MNAKLEQTLVPVSTNLIDLVWNKDNSTERPACPSDPIKMISTNFTGKSTAEKLNDVRNLMSGKYADAVVLNQLDDIACKDFI